MSMVCLVVLCLQQQSMGQQRSVMSIRVNLNSFSVATEKPLNYIRVEVVRTGAPTSHSLVCTLLDACCLWLESMYR